MLLPEDHPREDVLPDGGRIVKRLRDLAEPLDADALHVGGPEGRRERDFGEDLQHRAEGVRERGHREARGVRVRRRAVPRAQILERARHRRRVARRRAFVQQIEREGG